MGNNICQLQNREDNIILLAIQGDQYRLAKIWAVFSFFLSVLLIVILTIIKAFLAYHYPDITPIVSKSVVILCLFIGLGDFFVRKKMNEYRRKGALFQELFDHHVIGFDWNDLLVGNKPSKAEIGINIPDSIDYGSLVDWYNEKVSMVEGYRGSLLCQLVNCVYDDELRKKYFFFVNMTMMLSGILVLVFGLLSGITFMSMIVLVAQIMPILLWYLRFYDDYKTYFISVLRTIKYIEKCLTSTDQDIINSINHQIRNIQDRIFETRTRTFLIPDYVYTKMRSQCAATTNRVVESYINDDSI
jgi:hypothetical protein